MSHPVWRYDDQMPPGRPFAIFHSCQTAQQPLLYHSHDYYEVYFIMQGSIRVIVDEQELMPVMGEALLYPPGCMHRVTHLTPAQAYERFYIYLSRDFLHSAGTPECDLLARLEALSSGGRYCFRPGRENVAELAAAADEIIEAARDTSPAAVLTNRCRMIMYLVRLLDVLEKSVAPETGGISCRMSGLLRYINQNVRSQLTLDHLAKVFGISKFSLLHEFKEHTGMSIYQYVITRRIALAQQLIRQGVKPREASTQCGFTDYSSFYRAFKARTGLSPGQFGKKNKD